MGSFNGETDSASLGEAVTAGRLSDVVQGLLASGALTLEALHARLAARAPELAVRGPKWLAWQLARDPFVQLAAGRYELASTDADEAETLANRQDSEGGDGRVALLSAAVDTAVAQRYVVLDLETNADRANTVEHEIIEIAARRVEEGAPTEGFHTLVRNERTLSATVTELTGLTDADLVEAPLIDEALEAFLNFG